MRDMNAVRQMTALETLLAAEELRDVAMLRAAALRWRGAEADRELKGWCVSSYSRTGSSVRMGTSRLGIWCFHDDVCSQQDSDVAVAIERSES